MRNAAMNQKLVLFFGFLLAILSLPLFINRMQNSQETRSRAAQSASIYITPNTTSSSPLLKSVGETFSIDIVLNPDVNIASFIKLEMVYDASKLTASSQVNINTSVLPEVLEAPVVNNGKITASLGVGSNPALAITGITRIATVTFTARSATTTPTQISFGSNTQVLSLSSDTSANENILASKLPAYITITTTTTTPTPTSSVPTNTPAPTTTPKPTPTNGPSATPRPTSIPTATTTPRPTQTDTPTATPPPGASPTPTIQPTSTPLPTTQPSPTVIPTSGPTPTKSPEGFRLVLKLFLHGIGASGDSVNPKESTYSNKNPIHQERMLEVEVVNSDNETVSAKTVPAFYNIDGGVFFSHVDVPTTLPDNEYVVKIKTDKYRKKIMPDFFRIQPGKTTQLPQGDLIAGDVNNDNAINILDYNILNDCGYGVLKPLSMMSKSSLYNSAACQAHEERQHADLNDNGTVEKGDYNLFLREFSVQFGD